MTEEDAKWDASLARFFGPADAHEVVKRVIARLPPDVRKEVVEDCLFVAIGFERPGVCFPVACFAEVKWVIFLDVQARDLEAIVAHEIAHAVDAHEGPDGRRIGLEERAEALAESWGFPRARPPQRGT